MAKLPPALRRRSNFTPSGCCQKSENHKTCSATLLLLVKVPEIPSTKSPISYQTKEQYKFRILFAQYYWSLSAFLCTYSQQVKQQCCSGFSGLSFIEISTKLHGWGGGQLIQENTGTTKNHVVKFVLFYDFIIQSNPC